VRRLGRLLEAGKVEDSELGLRLRCCWPGLLRRAMLRCDVLEKCCAKLSLWALRCYYWAHGHLLVSLASLLLDAGNVGEIYPVEHPRVPLLLHSQYEEVADL
jgi:hypothetical protein